MSQRKRGADISFGRASTSRAEPLSERTGLREFSVRAELREGYAVAEVSGIFGLPVRDEAREHLLAAMDLSSEALIVDMSGVQFCDSSGLGVFAHLARTAQARGSALVVTGVHGRVARTFELTGMHKMLTLCPDLDAAVTELNDAR